MTWQDWNGFKGAAKRIEDIDLPRIGHEIGVGEDVIHAILDVESRGYGFDKANRPIILFEPHVFYKQLRNDPQKLNAAVKAGLAYQKWGTKPYPKDSYPRLKAALAIDETAALKSCSWGLGQVMGFNYGACGYSLVQDFVRAMMDDEDKHLQAMIDFIVTNSLDDELRALQNARNDNERLRAAANFARGYNGSGYAKHNYHGRILARYKWWQRIPDTAWNPMDAVVEDISAPDVPVPEERPEITSEVEAVLDDADKPAVLSTTNIAATAATASGVATAAKQAVDATKGVTMSVTSFAQDVGPWVLLAVLFIGIGGYIFYERYRKAKAARKAKASL